MATPVENARTALANALARLAELDAVPVDTRARMSYGDGEQQYGWNEYRASLVAEADRLADLVGKVRAATSRPYLIRSRYRG